MPANLWRTRTWLLTTGVGVDGFADDGVRLTNYCPESQCTPTRAALLTGRHAVRSGTHGVPLGAPPGWGLTAWEQTIGELLSAAGYRCAVYGKWHVGEGAGRWPTDKGFAEWYGPPRTYDEALWSTDPFYDPERDPVSRMVEIKDGDADVTEGEQLTLEVRRDCDLEYLRRTEAFIRDATASGMPWYVYFKWRDFKLVLVAQKSAQQQEVDRPAHGPELVSPSVTGVSTGYARCSTDKRDLTAQRHALRQLGVSDERMYLDHGMTGRNRSRPGLQQALAAVREGDTLVVPKLDRLARSVPDA